MAKFKNLRSFRRSLGLSLKNAAKLLFVSFTTLGQYERGDVVMPQEFQKKYEALLEKCSHGEIQYKKSPIVAASAKNCSGSEKLKALRKTLGLSQAELGVKIGVSGTSICKYENGTLQEKEYSPAGWIIDEFLLKEDLIKKFSALNHSFELEHCYKIFTGKQYGNSSTAPPNGEVNERSYVFRYVGKQGIHHCFKEIHGGWGRTYTDAQLIGKSIQEVNA